MTIRNVYASETWDKVYTAFEQINFTSYNYDTVKESLIQYLQIYYPESFNDFIESSEIIMILEMFAYAAELLAYRTDAVAHENFMSTAQRKQSVLRLAKLISYNAARNIPGRGLVKIDSIRTDEPVFDSLGNNLSGVTIVWNDPNNSNWKEQFFLVVDSVITTRFGQPAKSFQIGDVLMQQYTFNNTLQSFRNGVFPFSARSSASTVPVEITPIDIGENGPFERDPDQNSQFTIAYASDGRGDGSDFTGFLMFIKQGTLTLTNYEITEPVPNRRVVLNQTNVNNTDVWVYETNDSGAITRKWTNVPSLIDQSLAFNDIESRYKYEVESLENDRIALIFGDGDFSEIPVGQYQLWTRSSVNQVYTIPKSRIVNQSMAFSYVNERNVTYNCTLSFSLTSAIQNSSVSEEIEHVRQAAPSTYYAQNRMVNAQDYNTFMLRDSTILKLNSINRTFAGQPKYIEWNDASGAYQNIKLFGDDLVLRSELTVNSVTTTSSGRVLIDSFIEPTLSSNSILNILTHQMANSVDETGDAVGYGIISSPRRKFIEDNRKGAYRTVDGFFVQPYGQNIDSQGNPQPIQLGDGSLLEKTAIQAAIDGRWYGEPLSTILINGVVHGVIPDPVLNPESSGRLYAAGLPRTIDGVNTYPPGDTGSGTQPVGRQSVFGLKFNRFLGAFGNGNIEFAAPLTSNQRQTDAVVGVDSFNYKVETLTIELQSDETTFSVTSNIRGKLPDYSLTSAALTANRLWSEQTSASIPVDFKINTGTDLFEVGDAFIVDISFRNPNVIANGWGAEIRTFGNSESPIVNLSGWWEVVPSTVIIDRLGIFTDGPDDGPNAAQQMLFDQTVPGGSWIFLVSSQQDDLGNIVSWTIYNRDMKVIAESPTTKFWYNQDAQIIDSETLKPLYDKIRILRSNLDEFGMPLRKADIYDTVGFVFDENGEIVPNALEVLPTDTINFIQAGDGIPDNILQFENFARGSYRYALLNFEDASNPQFAGYLPCGAYTQTTGYDQSPYDFTQYDTVQTNITFNGISGTFLFDPGNFLSRNEINGFRLYRQFYVPGPGQFNPTSGEFECNTISGLDFMWQHYTPNSNLIDPSVSNIHDTYILTQGYFNSVSDYVRGLSNIMPIPPTPLDLRTSYGYLLDNKMLSDTVVLHSGRIKLLFGQLAEQPLRAKFRVVMSSTSTMSSERVKQEIVNIINEYFKISDWDFGQTFYATELLSLIHQGLSSQIASVVIVPTNSVNSFGSLFTIESGIDEVLQSCATVNDVEIVQALTPTMLRQS